MVGIEETIVWIFTENRQPDEYGYYLVCFDNPKRFNVAEYRSIPGVYSRWFIDGHNIYSPIYWAKVRTPIE